MDKSGSSRFDLCDYFYLYFSSFRLHVFGGLLLRSRDALLVHLARQTVHWEIHEGGGQESSGGPNCGFTYTGVMVFFGWIFIFNSFASHSEHTMSAFKCLWEHELRSNQSHIWHKVWKLSKNSTRREIDWYIFPLVQFLFSLWPKIVSCSHRHWL